MLVVVRGAWIGWLVVVMCGCDCYSSRHPGATGGDGIDSDGTDSSDADAGADAGSAVRDAGGDSGPATDGGAEDAGTDPSEPIRLDEALYAWEPHVAMDGAGNATVAWAQSDGVQSRRWEPLTGWTDTEAIGPGDSARVDFNARGDGVVLWRDSDANRTRARMWDPGAGWLVDEAIGSGQGFGEVAIDGSGNVVALFDWSYSDTDRVQTARYEPATGWSDAVLVEPYATDTRMPAIAANEAGDFVGVWTHFEGEHETLWASRWDEAAWSAASPIDSLDGTHPKVSVDGAGNGLVVASVYDDDGDFAIWGTAFPLGEIPGEPEYISSCDGTTTVAIASASDGTAFAAWEAALDVQAILYDPVTGWGDITRIDGGSGNTDLYEALRIAADDVGGATVVWSQEEEGDANLGVWVSRYVADEGWTDAVRIDPAEDGSATRPDVAVAPDGTAAVVWAFRPNGSDRSQVWAAILPP